VKKTLFAGTGGVLLALIGVLLWHLEAPGQSASVSGPLSSATMSTVVSHGPCLQKNEYSDFPLSEKRAIALNSATATVIDVYIRETNTDREVFTFKIDHVRGTYDTAEFQNCGVYVHREFGQDTVRGFPPGYRAELWKYDYSGYGAKLFTTFEIGSDGKESIYYDDDFRVDPTEHYLAGDQGYQQSAEALVVKDLASLKNLFVLPLSDIVKQDPTILGAFSFVNGGWSRDGRYIWYDFNDPVAPADVIGFVRVDTSDWSYQLFKAPLVTMGGDAFNPNTGMTTYSTNVAPWTGDAQLDQLYRDRAKSTDQLTSFYVYDLLAKRSYLVATTSDPTHYFQPKWISDNLLGFTLPSGVTTTYTLH
jgi:hypothetical protein